MRKLALAIVVTMVVWLLGAVAALATPGPQLQTDKKTTVGTTNCSKIRAELRQSFLRHPELRTRTPALTAWAESSQPGMDVCNTKLTVTRTRKVVSQSGIASVLGTTTALAW